MTKMEIANGETKAEKKAKVAPKAKTEPKAEKKATPEYPKWPEVPATYTQTVRAKIFEALSLQEEHGLASEYAGAHMIASALQKGLTEVERPFESANAKAWVTKERLKGLLNATLSALPDSPLPEELKVHPDLDILYRRGGDRFVRVLATKVKVEL